MARQTATTQAETKGEADQAVAHAQIQFVIASIAVVGLVLACGAGIGWGLRAGVGALVGAMLAVVNLWSLKRVGAGFFGTHGSRRRLWGVVGALKFLVLAGLVVVLLAFHLVQPIAFVVGYAALPVGITLGTLLGPKAEEDLVH